MVLWGTLAAWGVHIPMVGMDEKFKLRISAYQAVVKEYDRWKLLKNLSKEAPPLVEMRIII